MWILIDRKPVRCLHKDDIDLRNILKVGDVIQYESEYAELLDNARTPDNKPIISGRVADVRRYHVDVITPWGRREGVNWWNIYSINSKERRSMTVYKKILGDKID